jgi:mediator of RNA polymerase II transcription subunit 27
MDQINQALTAIRVLRSSVTTVFDTLGNGVIKSESGELEKDNKFLTELTELLNSVNNNLREVETTVGCLQPPAGNTLISILSH